MVLYAAFVVLADVASGHFVVQEDPMLVVGFDLMEALRDFARSFRGLPLAPVRVSCQFWRQHDAARGLDFQMAF